MTFLKPVAIYFGSDIILQGVAIIINLNCHRVIVGCIQFSQVGDTVNPHFIGPPFVQYCLFMEGKSYLMVLI